MNTLHNPISRQAGVMLLEALISLLIFSLGILAIIGLQASAINSAGEAKYRTDASLLANALIASMWTSNRTQATLQANFQSPNGTGYVAWLNSNVCPTSAPSALPGIDCTNKIVNMPSVTIVSDAATATPSNVATITIYWQDQGASSGVPPHQYTTVAQIND